MVGRTKVAEGSRKLAPDIVTTANTESNAEVKATKELFALAVEQEDELNNLLAKITYWRTLRVCAWMMRFIRKARTSKPNRARGPLTTEEIEVAQRNSEGRTATSLPSRGADHLQVQP